jgi:hypothetical protein
VKITISVPSKQFDDYCTRARSEAVSVPELIRRQLGNKTLKNRQPTV